MRQARLAAAAATTVLIPSPSIADADAHAPPPIHRPCRHRYTIHHYEQWIRAHARHGEIPQSAKPRMWTLERCQAHGQPARLAGIRWRIHYLRALTYALTHPFKQAIASWYNDAGSTACGFHAGYGVANRSLPCGTRVEFRYGGRDVTAIVQDRGPYANNADWDLNQNTAGFLGFGGVGFVGVRVLP